MSKKQYLDNIIIKTHQDILFKQEQEQEQDFNIPKYFVTFPYPYMNGLLHLGHAYTLIKCDIMARYKHSLGYNVLFPFSYHATGMPIVAAALNLKKELENGGDTQTNILLQCEILEQDIYKFVEPTHWVKYFINECKKDLDKFGVFVDHSKSFTTSVINPYYDMFIKWQFNKYNEKNIITFGKRHMIYSIDLKQPCSDHDIDSNCTNLNFNLVNLVIYKLNILYNDKETFYIDGEAINNNMQLCSLKLNDIMILVWLDDYLYQNMHYQNYCIEKLEKSNYSNDDLKNAIISKHSNIDVYLLESKVYTRNKERCIIAEIDQYYINYKIVKDQVLKYVNDELEFKNIDNKIFINNTVNWLQEYPCSRSVGLGTRLLDTDYLIDSLSDSTVYMALYTIYDDLVKIPVSDLTFEMFDYIFYGKPLGKLGKDDVIKPYEELLNNMRNKFNYYYPVDLRISGKDLLTNHLTMSLFSHEIMNFKNIKSIFGNGHILVNGQKMSKSLGNFITLRKAIDKYNVDVCRFALAEAGSYSDDANWLDDLVESSLLNIYDEIKYIEALFVSSEDGGSDEADEAGEAVVSGFSDSEAVNNYNDFIDKYFIDKLSTIYNLTIESYETLNTQKIIKNGFYNLVNEKKKYIKLCKQINCDTNIQMLKLWSQYFCVLLYPIMPHFITYLNKQSKNHLNIYLRNVVLPTIDYVNLWSVDNALKSVSKINSYLLKNNKYDTFQIIIYEHTQKQYELIEQLMAGNDCFNNEDKKFINYVKSFDNNYYNYCSYNNFDTQKKYIEMFLNNKDKNIIFLKGSKNNRICYDIDINYRK
ncbi:leucyl-tRNA synthetase [Hokovirus HKV1]|uniref:leucine--tRNA ligase n=1 Tax=Hokovirus HKV1 TaxID=1977638 RepID=A0A1V0SFC8_9VIRU|nr:leucyl-tRNA synthetase [Hokovirus HKV1]